MFGSDYPTPDGTCIRDYIHVDDLADAHVRALDYLAGGGATVSLNVGTGVGTSVLEVIEATERIAGRPVPHDIVARRPGDPVATYADPTLIGATLGWRSTKTLDDIIGTAWAWHSTHPDGYDPYPTCGVSDAAPWTANAVLGDGETVSIRPITPADAPRLAAFHERQSDESRYRRYFTPKPTLSDRELEHFTNVDLVDRAALLVESHGELLGWASYERWPGRDDADTAFMVDDAHQGIGIATLLLEHLAAIAVSNGIERFTAEVLGENRPMLAVFARAGWPLQRRYDSGVIEVDFPIADDPGVRRLDEPARAARRQPGDRPHAAAPLDRRHRRDGPPRIGRRRRCGATSPRRPPCRSTPSTGRARHLGDAPVYAQRRRHPRRRLAGGHRRPRRVARRKRSTTASPPTSAAPSW